MDASTRRGVLLNWLRERSEHAHLTASEIADVSGIYHGHGKADRCFDDLKALERRGVVWRRAGRPARWNPA